MGKLELSCDLLIDHSVGWLAGWLASWRALKDFFFVHFFLVSVFCFCLLSALLQVGEIAGRCS